MAYDVELAERVRAAVVGEPGLTERTMFGGRAFLVHGHLAVSASSRGGLLLRIDPAAAGELLADPRVTPFEMRSRELAGWLHVDAAAVETDADLRRWVAHGVTHARSLPPK